MPRIRVGLTGGIASGKSLVSGMLAGHGAVIIDADLLARRVVEPDTPGLRAVVERFGAGVLGARGGLDRAALGRLVFSDPVALADLDAIIHPLVRRAASALDAAAGADDVVVHDIPLLVESGQAHDFDLLVVVDVPEELQLDRLIHRDGLASAQARARLAAQATRKARLELADVVIDNSGSKEHTGQQVDALWRRLARPGHPGSRGLPA